MRALVLGGAVALLIAGCASIGTPHAPIETSPGGRLCVRQCQSLHERCVTNVNRELGESYWNFTATPMRSCNDNLGRCYATCPPG